VKPTAPQDNTSGAKYLWILIIVFAVVAAGALFQASSKSGLEPEEEAKSPSQWDRFSILFEEEIVPKYQGMLSDISSKVISRSFRSLMDREPNSPPRPDEPVVVYLLGSNPNPGLECLALDLATIVDKTFDNESVKKGDILRFDHKTGPQEVNSAFHKTFEDQAKKYIIMSGMEKLRGKAAQALHQFTDHKEATFAKAVIIVVGYLEKPRVNLTMDLSLKDMDKLAFDLLENSWKDSLSADIIASLLSRLTSSVAIVLPPLQESPLC
jgi:hypothetical protein